MYVDASQCTQSVRKGFNDQSLRVGIELEVGLTLAPIEVLTSDFTGYLRHLRRRPGHSGQNDDGNAHVSICRARITFSALVITHGSCIDETARDTVLPFNDFKTVAMSKLRALCLNVAWGASMADISSVCIDIDARASVPVCCTGQDRAITSVFADLGVLVAYACIREGLIVASVALAELKHASSSLGCSVSALELHDLVVDVMGTDSDESQSVEGKNSQKSGEKLEVHCGVPSW